MTLFPSGISAPTTAAPGSQLGQGSLFPNGAPPPTTPTPSTDNGPSIFGWHPSMPNLGGFKALGQLASGFLALPEIVVHPNMWPQLAGGIVSGLAGVASTVTAPIGVPGFNVGENIIEPAADALTGQKAQDFWQMAKHNGPLYGAINTVMNALPVTGPVSGALGAAADVADVASEAATGAATAAAEGGTLPEDMGSAMEQAQAKAEIIGEKGLGFHPFAGLGTSSALSQLEAVDTNVPPDAYAEQVKQIADALRSKADLAHAIAHPFGALAHGFAEQTAASFQKLYPSETVSPEAPPSASDLANAMTMNRSGESLTPADIEAAQSGARALQDPTKGAAEVMSGSRLKTPSILEDNGQWATNITPEEKAATRGELTAAEEEARANTEVPGTGAGTKVGEIEARIAEPAAAWATRMAERLPDSVNQVLAQWNGTVDKFRINQVRRSLASWVEVQQRMSQQSDAVQASVRAGQAVIDALPDLKISRLQASQMVGEELNAIMRGNQWLGEMLRTDGDPALGEAMVDAARAGYKGLTLVWDQIPPDAQEQILNHLHDASDAWKLQMQQRMQLLLASRPGATGLEAAILGLDRPLMTASQLSEYRKAKLMLRMQGKLEARAANEIDVRWREMDRLNLNTQRLSDEAEALRNKEGVALRNMEDLKTPTPRALNPQTLARLTAELQDAINNDRGGITFDPGTGETGLVPNAVVVVGIAQQGDKLTVADTLDRTSEIIRNAVENPVKPNGTPYPDGIWGGTAKLGFYVSPIDGLVSVDLSLDSHPDGTPLSLLEGDVLGTAYKQEATYDVAADDNRMMSQDPMTQNLMMHYVEDTMNQESDFSRVLKELTQATAGSENMNPDDAFRALQTYARWDYALASSNPEAWKIGDLFHIAQIDYGQLGRGNVRYAADDAQLLGQTVMRMLPGSEVNAIESMDALRLHTALQWYYDSHDYTEGTYRYNPDGTEKMITLLNGEQRSAAEVFYDLIAVTSVQASPTQNFGRALMGLANMDDFLGSHADAAANAQSLMDRLEAMQPDILKIVAPGTPEEHEATGYERGTALSNRFVNSPEVRAITEQTQMTNAPKYRVMDVLSGRLKLDSATAGDLQHSAEWWGNTKTASADSMDRVQVLNELDRQGATGPAIDAYRNYVGERNRLGDINDQVKELVKNGYTPGKAFQTNPEWVQEFGSKSRFDRAYRDVKNEETAFLEDNVINRAHDQALMEHQGSSMLAKLRSFRSNLSAPETSLAVTLDSVMGRLWGFNSQQWDKVGFYAQYADRIRSIADELSAKWGRTVAPHEVQAALWVYAKQEIGRQDWGRLLAHHDIALDHIDAWEKGAPVLPEDRNLLADYTNEEVGYSNEAQSIRGERQFLGKEENTGFLTPEQENESMQMRFDFADYKRLNQAVVRGELTPSDPEWAEYEQLREKVGEGRTSQITTVASRNDITTPGTSPYEQEIRYEIPYDSNKLKAQMERVAGWNAVNADVQTAIDNQDWAKARQLVTQWVVGQRQSILGSASGSSFGITAEGQLIKGELGIADENSTFAASNRLSTAQNVPTPADMSRTRFRLDALREMHDAGQLTDEQYANEVHKWELSQENEGPLLAQRSPAEPGMRRIYRGSDYAEPVGMQGMWWTDHEPYGRGGYAHWQETQLPNNVVDDLKSHVLQDRDRLDPAGTPVVGRDLMLDPMNPLHQSAMDRAMSYMHDSIDHGDMADLHQSFETELRGALMDHPTQDGHLVMRMFKNAALDTLVHEGAHLLRRILPSEDLAAVEEAYPGITASDVAAGFGESVANPVRVAAEEKFVADLMSWMRSKVQAFSTNEATGEVTAEGGEFGTPVETFARNANVEAAFGKIAASLEDNVPYQIGSPIGSHGFDINSFWTRMFYPEIDKPDVLSDPIAAGVPQQKGVEVSKFRYETDAKFAQRARLYGQARMEYQNAARLADLGERAAVRAETMANKFYVLLTTTPSDLEQQAARYGEQADKILARLAQQIENPDVNKVPMQWRPLWSAIVDLKEQVALDKTGRLAEIAADIPQTFQAMLREAAARGFDPTFLPDMTWEQAQRSLFGHITLGADQVALDSTRKTNQGILTQAGIANQSIEQLAAGLVAATKELYTNTLIDHIEQYYTQPLAAGAAIPNGWRPWSAEREYIVTGTRPTGEIAATHADLIVPDHVGRALDSMSQTYDHWTFHTLTRANSIWRTWQLTLSPRYYIHLFIANMVRVVASGAGPRDFMETMRSWKAGTLPEELTGLDMQTAYHQLVTEGNPTQEMASVFQLPGYKEAQAEADTVREHVSAAITSTKQSLEHAHGVLDKFSRGIIFEKALRDGLTRDAALSRSIEVMGDYGALSPFERGIVRSIMPFYPYYKSLVKLLARFPADHPGAALVLMQAGTIHQEYMQDLLHGSVPDSMATDFNLGGLRNFSILDPFITAAHVVEPRQLASALSPFVNILLSTAYNAATKGAMTPGFGPTGKKEALYDPFKGLLQVGEAAPPVLAAQGLLAATPLSGVLGGSNAYGQSPGLSQAVGKYLGIPQPVNVTAEQKTLNPTPAQRAATRAAGVVKAKATREAHRLAKGSLEPHLKAPKGGFGKPRREPKLKEPKLRRVASSSSRSHHGVSSPGGGFRVKRLSSGRVAQSRAGRAASKLPTLREIHIAEPPKPKQSKVERIAAFRLRKPVQSRKGKGSQVGSGAP